MLLLLQVLLVVSTYTGMIWTPHRSLCSLASNQLQTHEIHGNKVGVANCFARHILVILCYLGNCAGICSWTNLQVVCFHLKRILSDMHTQIFDLQGHEAVTLMAMREWVHYFGADSVHGAAMQDLESLKFLRLLQPILSQKELLESRKLLDLIDYCKQWY